MMVETRRRQTREVRGPDPNSVALIARPTGRQPPDKILMDRRMKEDQLIAAEELAKLARMQELRNDWEKCTDRKIQANVIRRRVHGLLQENEVTLEARRARLRELLETEKMQHAIESCNTQETTLEKQSRLRERAKQLREKREAERLAFVEEKLEQQFREQCEELRSATSKHRQDEILAERQDQLRMKKEMEQERKSEEDFFAQMWYADIESKAKREEMEARRQRDANLSTVAYLQQQMAALEDKRRQEKQLVEEEAHLLREEEELRKVEEQRAAEEKRRLQLSFKRSLDQTLSTKREIEAKQAQEELAFDRKILEQLLEQTRTEMSEQANRKREIREEEKRYRQYLQQLKEEEKRREVELEKLCDAEVEKMWEKRVQQWKVEKMARQKLLEEVLASRQQQLQDKLSANAAQRQQASREREQLLQQIAENKRLEMEQVEQARLQNVNYRTDLLGQIDYNNRQRADAVNEERRIVEQQWDAEREYRRKIEYLRDKPVPGKLHPVRRRAYQSAGSQRASGSAELLFA